MKYPLATTGLVLAAALALAPLAARADDSDSDRSKPAHYVKNSVITTKIKTKLAEEHLASAKHIHVDTDKHGAVWLSGTANSQDEADQAVAIARATEGVQTVQSRIKVHKDR
jgi:hyperosmotically inducible periplasmic protein